MEKDESVDKRWRKYGQKYWFEEYKRFGRIFFDPWLRGGGPQQRSRKRKLIARLPGNHDLGLGNGIRLPVRNRFNAYFGEGNGIDIIGNHTFVSVDTVSLSAKGQPDPATGTQRSGDEGKLIWESAEQFLHQSGAIKARAIQRHLRAQSERPQNEEMEHGVTELGDPRAHTIASIPQLETDIPSIVLTHVPLYRAPGTPCGPLRERFPPARASSGDGELPNKDEANAIHVQAGEQYQNVLTSAVSNEMIELIGDVRYIFSGDDHDYCEVVHRQYTSKGGGIREITVKSISWAMGVRKPGFLLLSLWNPIDTRGKVVGGQEDTVQSHLCLLPDQLAIFIRYGWLLALTLVMISVHSARVVFGKASPNQQASGSILPMATPVRRKEDVEPHSSTSSTSDPSPTNGLAVRPNATRPRSTSRLHGYGCMPPMDDHKGGETKQWDNVDLIEGGRRRSHGRLRALFLEIRRSIGVVAAPVCVCYGWFLWNS